MKDKLNNALDNIDERFIEEAARAGRTAGGAPRWLKFAAIPAVAAAAVVCVFAVRGSIQKPGVDLITQSAGTQPGTAEAVRIPLLAPTREAAENICFSAVSPRLLYADEEQAVFTDSDSCVFIYSFDEYRIVFSADIRRSAEKFNRDQLPGDTGALNIYASADGQTIVRLNISGKPGTYAVDPARSLLEPSEGAEKYTLTPLDESSGLPGASEYAPTADGGVILLAPGGEGSDLNQIVLARVCLGGDGSAAITERFAPFTEEYYSSLESESGFISEYECDGARLRFDSTDGTVLLYSAWDGASATMNGTYSLNGNDLRIDFGDADQKYRAVMDEASITIRNADMFLLQRIYPELSQLDTAAQEEFLTEHEELTFTRINSAVPEDEGAPKENASEEAPEPDPDLTGYAELNLEISRLLYSLLDEGAVYDQQKADELILDGALPLDSPSLVQYGDGEYRIGVDLRSTSGTGGNIYAFQSGTVVWTRSLDGMGNCVVIDHGYGLATVYLTAGELAVTSGEQVEKGGVIAAAGASGDAPDVTFEIRRNSGSCFSTKAELTNMLNHAADQQISGILSGDPGSYDSAAAQALIGDSIPPLDMDFISQDYSAGQSSWDGVTYYGCGYSGSGMDGEAHADVLACQQGTVIAASSDGSWNDGLGNFVVINHGAGVASVYAHLSGVSVSVGQSVNKGDVIAQTGSTGWTDRQLLHFELRENGNVSAAMSKTESGTDTNTAGNRGFIWPVGGDGGLISELMDGSGGYYGHLGIDIAAPKGTPVIAAGSGTVLLADWYYGYGNCIVVNYGGLNLLYGHLDKVNVEVGQQISKGDEIGAVGSTGQAAGDHLHFEVIKGSPENGERLDPIEWLPAHKTEFEQ